MEFKDIVHQRRAVNFFDTERDVSDDQLREMVGLAARAPSSFNLQPWSLILLKDLEEKMRLRKVAWDQPKVSEAPVVLIVLADRDAWRGGHPFVERNFREMVQAGSMTEDKHDWFLGACSGLYGESPEKQQAFACKNAGFFAMTLMFAAKHLGLDTHPMDGFDHEGVRREFKIPDSYWIPLLLAVGYFDRKKTLQPPKWRKAYEEILVRFH
ncbi:MAG: nitroreductase family protein [Deltaproteobacteria bacterium]|nr:nitroreductase family protein [Deltaproteobacteria bacterium]